MLYSQPRAVRWMPHPFQTVVVAGSTAAMVESGTVRLMTPGPNHHENCPSRTVTVSDENATASPSEMTVTTSMVSCTGGGVRASTPATSSAIGTSATIQLMR